MTTHRLDYIVAATTISASLFICITRWTRSLLSQPEVIERRASHQAFRAAKGLPALKPVSQIVVIFKTTAPALLVVLCDLLFIFGVRPVFFLFSAAAWRVSVFAVAVGIIKVGSHYSSIEY